MRVLGHRVLVKRERVLDRKGLIWVPDRAKQLPQGGTVIAVGAGVDSVTPGDQVIFGKYAGVEVKIAGETYVMLWDKHLMGVLDPPVAPVS